MRFKTRGNIATEDILEVAQRVIAQVQEAGVDHVSGLNIYLTPTDATGKHRRFVKDGLGVDQVEIETWDLAVAEPESTMSSVYANERANTAEAPQASAKFQGGRGRRQRVSQ